MKTNCSSPVSSCVGSKVNPSPASFVSLTFLEQIRRPLLARFFERFHDELTAAGVHLRADCLDDAGYCFHLRFVLASHPGLPHALIEALHDIHALANPAGQQRLEEAAAALCPELPIPDDPTYPDLAMQLWLDAPAAFRRAHALRCLSGLATMESFGSPVRERRDDCWRPPNGAVLQRMQADLDGWFGRHWRGVETVSIQVHERQGECWFLVRHGDVLARKAAIERRQMQLVRYRPARDDVVAYEPRAGVLRIHARTRGEKELYRQVFGLHLFGDRTHFSERHTYTLDPLTAGGPDPLAVHDVDEIARVAFREAELTTSDDSTRMCVRHLRDALWGDMADRSMVRAAFDLFFADGGKPRKVEIRPPNLLKLSRHTDVVPVHQWLSKRGFCNTQRGIDVVCA